MSSFLDTSMLVRYLTGDPPALAEASARVIDGEEPLLVSDVVLVEAASVLHSAYGVPRDLVVDHLVTLLRKTNVEVFRLDTSLVIEGLRLCRPADGVSFADALVWAAARSQPDPLVHSLDPRFPADGLTVRRAAGER